MTRYDSGDEKRTDPRPVYILLGVDTEGGSHVYHTRSETVYTIEGTEVAYREDLEDRSINLFMDYVADRRGWQVRYLFRTAGDAITYSVSPEEAL
ncbi:hypothetical protein [Natrononativus amylolyticus]|uniref:hypothetical protein n=1 Tax=Natrononativus amylolyticus TaxID=2963434 RepID=UPI0020CF88AE|nr:hypothetical protein [Natrononativus amylolyticus]